MQPTLAMREWSTRRKVTTATALQMLWLGVLLTALTLWDLSLSVPVAIAIWSLFQPGGGVRALDAPAQRRSCS